MNIATDQINQARQLLDQAKDITIAIPNHPSLDAVASALSVYLALSAKGSQIKVICPSQMTVEFSHLVGVDKVSNLLSVSSGRNLVISFPYQEGSIEKVSYNIENETFNLVIEPREGYPIITQDVMRYYYGGGNTDLIITVGTNNLNDLNSIYSANQGLFSEKPIINIDINGQNSRYGRVNIVDPATSSTSELIVNLMSALGISLNPDIATNLLAGITNASGNFTSPQTSASTFEAAAICLRHGARKITGEFAKQPTATMLQPAIPTFLKPPVIIKPQPAKPKQPQTPFQSPQIQPASDTPPDWLKPKIYKGSTLL